MVTAEYLKKKKDIHVLYESAERGHGLDAIFVSAKARAVYLVFGKITITLTPEEFLSVVGVTAANVSEIVEFFDIEQQAQARGVLDESKN